MMDHSVLPTYENSINVILTLILFSPYQSISSFEHFFFHFSSDFFTYQPSFFVFWALNSRIIYATFYLVSEFLLLVIFWMLWIIIIVNTLKHMVSHANIDKIEDHRYWFASGSNEGLLILVIHVYNKNWRKLHKTSASQSRTTTKRKRRKKRLDRELQSFLRFTQTQ